MKIEKLPKKIAIFPLSNAVFFPKTILPLNIFEKRYIELVNDTMKEESLFGMVQPKSAINLKPEVYKVGCLGKIVNFNETKDKRFLINLSGLIRFRIKEEITTEKLYRLFKVDYSDFEEDLISNNVNQEKFNKTNLIKKIKTFFKKKNYFINFNKLEELDFDQLVSTICMISPFSIQEKQKLIETIKIEDKFKVFEEIIDFNLFDDQNKTIQ